MHRLLLTIKLAMSFQIIREHSFTIAMTLMLIILLFMFPFGIYTVIRDIRRDYCDRRECRRQIKLITEPISSEKFNDILDVYQTLKCKAKFVEFIRVNGLLIANRECEEAIASIARRAEAVTYNPKNRFYGWEEFLDEISMLLEVVRNNRKDT